jgi:hypothetical protein
MSSPWIHTAACKSNGVAPSRRLQVERRRAERRLKSNSVAPSRRLQVERRRAERRLQLHAGLSHGGFSLRG